MYLNSTATPQNVNNKAYGEDFTQEALKTALTIVKESVQGEREDELIYNYLINLAKTMEEKRIISSIRNDEINHRQWFKEIYKF